MPKEIFGPDYSFLEKAEVLTNTEILAIARAFAKLGIEKIRLTGGEPLLRKDLVPLVKELNGIDSIKDLSLTTNASLLPRYAQSLKEAGLSRVNISLDSLDEESFKQMSGGRGSVQAVLDGIDAAVNAGLDLKVNMVVKKGANESEILPMVRYFRKCSITLRFIEYMDVGNSNQWKLDEVVPAKEILNTINSEFKFGPIDPNYRGEVANRYQFNDIPLEFGIINSITKPFCSNCNRARLSADGKLYTCLFATKGHDLKSLIRSNPSEESLTQTLSDIWSRRTDRYSEERMHSNKNREKIEMSYIGG
jgi:cyclic pyranopterin phosphate synthase